MELAAGGDLRRLRGAGYLAVVPVLLEVAHALEHAHERGVVHGDLKPGNVLFDGAGRAKLADFGAAALLPAGGGDPAPRPLSPFTASPQQLRGEPGGGGGGGGARLRGARGGAAPLGRGVPRMPAVPGVLGPAALAGFLWLPRLEMPPGTIPAAGVSGPGTAEGRARLKEQRERFDRQLAVLETRGAGVWGGADFAAAKTRAAEAVGAYDAGSLELAQQRLGDASRFLDAVERAAPAALTAQLDAGDRALAAGQQELATQAFDLAARIDPKDPRVVLGQDRARRLGGVLPLLADAENAQAVREYARATQDYARALSLDPKNAQARAGLARATAAFGDDNYARAVGEGYAALGAGRLEEARGAFTRARTLRASGAEAQDGLRRVAAAAGARSLPAPRARAQALEGQERWEGALGLYNSALRQDRALDFAQEGKARSSARLELESSLQALIDRPDRLASPQGDAGAVALLRSAPAQPDPGPALRGAMGTVRGLLPGVGQPVHLSPVSGSLTQG